MLGKTYQFIITLSYLIIISLFIFFCYSKYILGDLLDNFVQRYEKNIFDKKKKKKKKKKKCIFALDCI